MKAVLIAIAAALIVVAAIAAFAPASLVDARIASITAGRTRLAETQGTVWRGRGVIVAHDGRWRMPVAWALDSAALLRGDVSIELIADENAPDLRGRARASAGRVVIDALQASVAGAIVGAFAEAPGVATGGEVNVRAESLVIAPGANSGTLEADWSNARARVADAIVDLGTIKSRLTGNGDSFSGPITSERGTIGVNGTVTLRHERIDAQLRLTPTPSTPPALRKALEAVGPADASGAVSLRLDRALR